YALQENNKAAKPWTVEELAAYLRTGFHQLHGVSRGTMGLVTAELEFADPADIEAMARAIVARMQPGVAAREPWAAAVEKSPMMPAYAGTLTDAQLEALVAWLRANLTNEPPWQGIAKNIAESRRMEPSMLAFPPGGSGTDPLDRRP